MATGTLANPLGRIFVTGGAGALAARLREEPAAVHDKDTRQELADTLDHYATALKQEGVSEIQLRVLEPLVASLREAGVDSLGDEIIGLISARLEAFSAKVSADAGARARMQRLSIWGDPKTVAAELIEALHGDQKTKMELWHERLREVETAFGAIEPVYFEIKEIEPKYAIEILLRYAQNRSKPIDRRQTALLLYIGHYVFGDVSNIEKLENDPSLDILFKAPVVKLMQDELQELWERGNNLMKAVFLETCLATLYQRNPSDPRFRGFTPEMRARLAK